MKIRHLIFIAILTALSGCGAMGQCSREKVPEVTPAVLQQKIDRKGLSANLTDTNSLDGFGAGCELYLRDASGNINDYLTLYPFLKNQSFSYDYSSNENGQITLNSITYNFSTIIIGFLSGADNPDLPFFTNEMMNSVTFDLLDTITNLNDFSYFTFKSYQDGDYSTWQQMIDSFKLNIPITQDKNSRPLDFTISYEFGIDFYRSDGTQIGLGETRTVSTTVSFTDLASNPSYDLIPDGLDNNEVYELESSIWQNNNWVDYNKYVNVLGNLIEPVGDKIYFNFTDLTASEQYQFGYNAGNENGYNNGYNDGINVNLGFPDFLNGVFNCMNNILNVEIFPNVRLWYILGIPLILGVIGFIIGFFRGGQ